MGKSNIKPLPIVSNSQPSPPSYTPSNSEIPTNLGKLSDDPQMLPPFKNILSPTNVHQPYAQEEYVGPNSKIFTQPYQQQGPQGYSPLMIPPGARYDPVDPFDNPMMERDEQPGDFVMGFD